MAAEPEGAEATEWNMWCCWSRPGPVLKLIEGLYGNWEGECVTLPKAKYLSISNYNIELYSDILYCVVYYTPMPVCLWIEPIATM